MNLNLSYYLFKYKPKPQFIAALGLLWKTQPERLMAMGVTDYKDINIDFFSSLKKPLAERFKPSYAVTGLVIIALIALVYFTYYFDQKASAKVDSLNVEYATTIHLLNKAQKANTSALASKKEVTDNAQNLQKQLEALEGEQQYIAGLQRDYPDEVMFIITALPPQCQYMTITMNSGGYTVIGEANSLSQVLSYTNTLENDSEFLALIKSVYPATTDRVQFELEINRK